MEAAILRRMLAATAALILFATDTVLADLKTHTEKRMEVLKQCQGRFKNKHLTEEELKRVLNDHKVWYETYRGKFNTKQAESDIRKANLCGADLRGANLSGADLKAANLSRVKLDGANLSEAELMGANLSWASLWGANLRGAIMGVATLIEADFRGANLSGAYLSNTNFSGAYFFHANLSGAFLGGANLSKALLFDTNLSGASLESTNLSGANLTSANFSGTLFQPNDLPDADKIAYAMNLSQMAYITSPQALVKLRNSFKEGGYYQQEREVTCAIQRSVTRSLVEKGKFMSISKAIIRYIFFDLTCQWGMVSSRALLILLTLIPVFAIPYVFALRLANQDGIWCKWTDDRMRLDLGTKEPTRLHIGWPKASYYGLYFSLISAFNIGWRELNVGNWIQRLQAKEYTLKATGWVRTVSGCQSLISVYLLAIWALTYFGQPFESLSP